MRGSSAKNGGQLCPVFGKCGACDLLNIPYDLQLENKRAEIQRLFESADVDVEVNLVLGMEAPFRYRDKVIAPYVPGKKPGQILSGMYAKGTHRIIPTDGCLLENEVAQKVTKVISDLMHKWKIEPYNEDTGKGFMRHAVVRVGHESGEVLVTLVTNSDQFPSLKSFCKELVRRIPQITTVVQSVNTRKTNVILGEKTRVLYGPGFILDTLCGLSFRISPHSFYQVNSTQTEVLYNRAIDMLIEGVDGSRASSDPIGLDESASGSSREKPIVVDAYCGTGTIGLVAAKRMDAQVIGVDSVEAAIKDARQNAKHNGIENATFHAQDATAFMEDLPAHMQEGVRDFAGRADLFVVMDPPRSGSTPEFLKAVIDSPARKVVYISCNPKTQVRDVKLLVEGRFKVLEIQPVDMFPHTEHTECIVSMERS